MEQKQPQPVSAFAQIVDSLRHRSDEELKLLYLRFFSAELSAEWKDIVSESDFGSASEEDIIKAIQKNRYNKSHA